MDSEIENRRPLTTRNATWAKVTAAWLAKNKISPNFISVLSMVFAVVAFLSFYFDRGQNYYNTLFMILAIAGIQGRLLMNMLDGMVAVEHHKQSFAGGLYNEVPDRVSDVLIITGAGLMVRTMSWGMELAYLASILAVMTAYIRALGASLYCGNQFTGPMAKPHRMALLTVGCLVAIWYTPIFYYLLIVMNIGLIVTCYRRLCLIYKNLKNLPIK